MTGIGKFLTYLNLLAAILMVTWAATAYVNRLDALDGKGLENEVIPGEISQMKDEIAKLAKSVAEVDSSYGTKYNNLSRVENQRDYRRGKYRTRLDQARKGSFFDQLKDSTDPQFTDLERVGKQLLTSEDKPLRGIDVIQSDLAKEFRDAQILRDGTNPNAAAEQLKKLDEIVSTPAFPEFQASLGTGNLRVLHGMLSDRIAIADRQTLKQREIFVNLRDEERFLSDKRVNWQSELQTLERRRDQLENRLKLFGIAPRASR